MFLPRDNIKPNGFCKATSIKVQTEILERQSEGTKKELIIAPNLSESIINSDL